jgi:hypothetical protein
MSEGSPLAVLRLWAQATADMMDVAGRFWNGVINLNPVERDNDTSVGEGSTAIPALAATTRLRTAAFVDGDGVELAVQEVVITPAEVGAGAGPTEVKIRVTASGECHGRFTTYLTDEAGTQVSDRFSVFMAQCAPPS